MNHWSLRRRKKKAKRWSQERKNTRDENLGLSDQGEVMGFLILSIQVLCRNLKQMPRLRTA